MRKIFSLLMVAVLSISTAFATTVYCKMTQSWWTQDGAAVGVHYWGGASAATTWPGVRMTPVSGAEGTWTYDVPADVEGLMFVRVNGSGDIADWGAKTANLTLPTDGKNLYTITSETPVWGDPGATGEWSVYAGEGGDDEVLNAFPNDSTSFIGYAWGEDVTKNKVIFDANNYIMMFSQGNNLQINANYGLQIGNSSKQSAFVFRLDEEADLKVGIARNGSDMMASLYYMGETIDTLTAANLATGGSLCSSVNIASDHQSDVLVKTKAAAGYYKVLGSLRFCCPYIVVTKNNVPPVAAKFYVTGNAALVGQDKEWNPAAIKSETDTLVLNLLAEQAYALKVTVDGTWNTAKGFNDLTEKPAGLSTDNDGNILFSLAEAGAVKVIYTAELFKVEGNFYVAPVEEPAKFYVTGDSALVVDAGLEAEKAWAPQAIRVDADTMVLNLNAEQEYKLKITLNGEWETGKGYSSLTETPNGLTTDNDDNIIFTLAEAGEVKVVYIASAEEQPEVFKLIGNFYVDPTPVVPTAAVTGDMTEWGEPIPFELSEDSTYATLSNDNIKKGTYAFKMIINGEWRSNGYEFHRGFPGCAGITDNTEANMTVVIDVEGAYTFKWYFANDSLAIIYPEKPEPQLENGYYMVGKFGGVDAWDPVAENLFAVNPDNEAEYQLAIDLEVNDEIKVVYVENDAIVTWYPNEGGNYVIDDHHNGETTMYFRPDYQGGEGWFAGCIYVIPTSTVGFENTAADAKVVKSLKNGILVIEKNNKVYNVLGIEMK